MFWKSNLKLSLRARLFVILVPLMTAFSIASLYFTREDIVRSTNTAYDRSLLGVIKSINLNVSNNYGGLNVELPYNQFEFFELTASGNVYFRVSTLDGLVEVGNHDLPPPPIKLISGKPIFYDGIYFGESVRVGAYLHSMSSDKIKAGEVSEWIVQVAETTKSREAFATALVTRSMWRDGFMLLSIWIGLGFGMAYGLKPILRLVRQVSGRSPSDLRPLPLTDISSEFEPLISAVNHQLQRTEKLMVERRNFIDDASHQLRTPLSVLKMQIDFALRTKTPESRERVLISLSEELGHAIRGTNQLLSLAESDASTVELIEFDLTSVVKSVVLELMPIAKAHNVDLGVDLKEIPLEAKGDPRLLSQALVNIVHNAIQHGGKNGIVTVSAFTNDSSWVIQVTDNGPGISEELNGRVGQRFAKGKFSRGSGLGLAIARTVMDSHSGDLLISPRSETNGTEVRLIWEKS